MDYRDDSPVSEIQHSRLGRCCQHGNIQCTAIYITTIVFCQHGNIQCTAIYITTIVFSHTLRCELITTHSSLSSPGYSKELTTRYNRKRVLRNSQLVIARLFSQLTTHCNRKTTLHNSQLITIARNILRTTNNSLKSQKRSTQVTTHNNRKAVVHNSH